MTTEPANLALVTDTLATARAAIAAGHLVDMSGLDLAVAELCAAAVRLPARHQSRAARKLARLAQDLSALADALTEQRQTLEHAAEAEARQRATNAYAADTAQS
ncbi:MAG: hypothetical protein ACREFI_09925 [Stellaceae bacterium]